MTRRATLLAAVAMVAPAAWLAHSQAFGAQRCATGSWATRVSGRPAGSLPRSVVLVRRTRSHWVMRLRTEPHRAVAVQVAAGGRIADVHAGPDVHISRSRNAHELNASLTHAGATREVTFRVACPRTITIAATG